jgi:hypothetical protein
MKKQRFIIFSSFVVVAFLFFFGYLILKNNVKDAPKKVEQEVSTISETQALSRVRERTEVVKYEAVLTKAGKKATFEVEDGDDSWSVHVFEIVSDGDSSHTATFGWYSVDKITGEIQKDL